MDPNVEIFAAAENGQIDTIRNYLSEGGDINVRNLNGSTLLHIAVFNEQEETVKFLIDAGANVNLEDADGEIPLMSAMDFDNKQVQSSIMKMLIEAGDVQKIKTNKDCNGRTAIHEAVKIGDVEIVQLLINLGVNVNPIDKIFKWTPLHYACGYFPNEDPSEMIEILLSGGAKINAKDFENKTPLHVLAYKTDLPAYPKIVEIFTKYEADLDAQDIRGMTPKELADFIGYRLE